MHSLASATIDAGVLAVPPNGGANDAVTQYVERLLAWNKFRRQKHISIYMGEMVFEALGDELYPDKSKIEKMLNNYGVVEYDANTLNKVVNALLNTTPCFEEHYCVTDVLLGEVETIPDVIKTTANGKLQDNLARCLVLIAVLRKHCSQLFESHLFMLNEAPSNQIQVKAEIEYLEHKRNDIPDLPSHPNLFEGDVLICDSFDGFIKNMDASLMLTSACDDTGIELAIRTSMFQQALERGATADWDSIVVPKVGSKFRELCQRICSDNDNSLPAKILRSIAKTINGEDLRAVHALRTGPEGGSPQKMRGGDKAQRRDIDNEFHLHYWECDNGKVELASVVYHNDFSIPKRCSLT